jgi:hypothetical protein
MCYSTDGQKRDIRRSNAKPSGGKGMSKFVKDNASKDQKHDEHTTECVCQASMNGLRATNPKQQEEKSGVNAEFDSKNAGDTKRPAHKA